MPVLIQVYAPSALPALRTVLREPTICAQYDMYEGERGAEHLLSDPYLPGDSVHLAFVDGEPAGFGCAIVLPGSTPWAMLRGGVLPRYQRRGIGRALHERVREYVRAQRATPGVRDIAIAAWQPLEPASAMAESLGYAHDRWFWLMARPRAATSPVPQWPAGVSVRTLADTKGEQRETMLEHWNDAYNDSFAHNYRYVASPLEHARELAARPGFRADGVLIAFRDGGVAGFCRTELHPSRGEIGTLGTLPAARGIGLGRALLRWGVAWLERVTPHPITLLVDGENEQALALYRSEGFVVERTRHIWAQAAAGS